MNKVAQQFQESGKLNEMINGVYKDNIEQTLTNLSNFKHWEITSITAVLDLIPEDFEFQPSHIDARNLWLFLGEYLKKVLEVNHNALQVAKRRAHNRAKRIRHNINKRKRRELALKEIGIQV